MKIIPADFMRKITFLEETRYANKCPMLRGKQIVCQIFSFLNPKRTSNLNDVLIDELHDDNVKMFNQA